MSIFRTAAKNDANAAEIVAALRAVGALVWEIRRPFDLLVRYRRHWWVLEIKNKKGKNQFTCQQQSDLRLLAATEGCQDAVYTVHDVREALEAIGAQYVEKNGNKTLYSVPVKE